MGHKNSKLNSQEHSKKHSKDFCKIWTKLQKHERGEEKIDIKWLEKMVKKLLIDLHIEDPSSDEKNSYLEGGFTPVKEELTLLNLEVKGQVPKELRGGVYIRDTSNPRFKPIGHYYWIDGDGMLHGLFLGDEGGGSYRNRYIKNADILIEIEENKGIWPEPNAITLEFLLKLAERWIAYEAGLSKYKPTLLKDAGNTNLAVLPDGTLLALYELGYPVQVDSKTLDTINYGYRLDKWNYNFTAHPKVDAVSGEMLGFCYDILNTAVRYGVWDKEMKLVHSTELILSQVTAMHDFAITEKYTIFMDLSFVFDKSKLFSTQPGPLIFSPTKTCRFGVLPRYGKGSEVKWFTSTSCFVFHTVNAFDRGDEVVLYGCRWTYLSFFPSEQNPNPLPSLYEWTFNMKTGDIKEREISALHTDFPTMNQEFFGRLFRYFYAAEFEPHDPQWEGLWVFRKLVKYDLNNAPDGNSGGLTYKVHDFGDQWAGEASFVPRENPKSEDDGFLVCFVLDDKTQLSSLLVLDALDFEGPPVAQVMLPVRVPFGFHGQFFTKKALQGSNPPITTTTTTTSTTSTSTSNADNVSTTTAHNINTIATSDIKSTADNTNTTITSDVTGSTTTVDNTNTTTTSDVTGSTTTADNTNTTITADIKSTADNTSTTITSDVTGSTTTADNTSATATSGVTDTTTVVDITSLNGAKSITTAATTEATSDNNNADNNNSE